MALAGFGFGTAFYGLRKLDVAEARWVFAPLYTLFVHKWWFDELYAMLFVRPVLRLAGWVAAIDRGGIDCLADGSARAVERIARIDDWIDRVFVDRFVNYLAWWTYCAGVAAPRPAERQRPPIRALDRGGHGGIVRVDQPVLEL